MAWRRAAQAQRAWATPTEAASGEEGGVHLWGGDGEFHPPAPCPNGQAGLGAEREAPGGTE